MFLIVNMQDTILTSTIHLLGFAATCCILASVHSGSPLEGSISSPWLTFSNLERPGDLWLQYDATPQRARTALRL